MLTLQTLMRPVTPAEVERTILSVARALGFPVTAWQSGGLGLTMVKFTARLYSDATALVANIAAGGFLGESRNGWLTLLAKNVFDEDRKPAIYTEGLVMFTCVEGAGPYSIQPGQLWVTTRTGRRFTNTEAFTIPDGGSVQATVRAESAGSAFNVGNFTIQTLVTPLPGVTVSNPPGSDGTWITVQGANEESDDSLRMRCRGKWTTIAAQPPLDTYSFWALKASNEVTRVSVDDRNPLGPGSLVVYLAGDDGPVSAEAVDEVDAALQARKAKTAIVETRNVTSAPIAVVGVVRIRSAFIAGAAEAAEAALDAFFQSLPIGGTDIGGGKKGVSREAIIAAIGTVPGYESSNIATPAADVELGAHEVATGGGYTLTFEAV